MLQEMEQIDKTTQTQEKEERLLLVLLLIELLFQNKHQILLQAEDILLQPLDTLHQTQLPLCTEHQIKQVEERMGKRIIKRQLEVETLDLLPLIIA